ncbi:MFS transporter [Mycolicibacterium sp. jd]|uniref:MFS transporter n=1 Tax=unclassified Mycolicibacterium TaxID=2636767 RepID=UPI00351BE24E
MFALSTSERIAYGAGSLATATYAVVPGLLLLYYLTNVLGVAASVAGFVVFLPKLLDVVCNPTVGRLSDTTVSRWGPRRPWMIAGMFIFPAGFVTIFACPFTGASAAWWVGLVIALTGMGFSAFVVPFGVLPAELGASSEERRSMTAWRMAFLGVAILAAGAVAPLMVSASGGGPQGYRLMAVVMGGLVFLGACAAIYSARRSAHTTVSAAPQGAGSFRDALTTARHNRPFSIVFIVFLLVEVVISVALAGLPYIAEQVLGSEDVVALLFVCVLAPLLLTMPIWTRSALRFGDKRCLQAALALLGLGASMCTALLWVDESNRFAIACTALLLASIFREDVGVTGV